MIRKVITALGVVIFIASCSSTKGSIKNAANLSEKQWAQMRVENVTIQEWVSGIQGGTNSLEFSMLIQSGSLNLIPDSAFISGYQFPIFTKNKRNYLGKTNKSNTPLPNRSYGELKITFKESDFVFVVSKDSIKVLDPIYMP